jgi:chemotaxis signal transduction protein
MPLSKKAKIERRGAEAKDRTQARQAVCFYIADVKYGIDVVSVEEIIRVREIRTRSDQPSSVRGVTVWREQDIPVIDLRSVLGYEEIEDGPDTRLIVIDFKDRKAAMTVDSIIEILRLEPSGLTEISNDEADLDNQYLRGNYIEDENQLRLLDIGRLLSDMGLAVVRPD